MTETPTVLVVEDERDLAELYAAWIDPEYPVRTAHDGEEALEELDEDVDVVLLDRRMPGLSGDEVLAEIRHRDVDCQVAMVTAVEPDFDVIDMGFDDYLVKPTTKEELHETIDRLTTRREYDDKLDRYVTLLSKRSVLESEKNDADLEEHREFAELEAEIADLEDEVDPMARELDADDAAVLFRDLTPQT